MEKLRKGTLKCPVCKKPLHFEQIHGMRMVGIDGFIDSKCVDCGTYYKVPGDV